MTARRSCNEARHYNSERRMPYQSSFYHFNSVPCCWRGINPSELGDLYAVCSTPITARHQTPSKRCRFSRPLHRVISAEARLPNPLQQVPETLLISPNSSVRPTRTFPAFPRCRTDSPAEGPHACCHRPHQRRPAVGRDAAARLPCTPRRRAGAGDGACRLHHPSRQARHGRLALAEVTGAHR